MATSKLFTSKLTQSQLDKVVSVAKDLNFNPNWLLAIMYFETAGTFSPSKTNNIGSVGLIQFTRDKAGVNYKTISGKQYSLSSIGKMTFEQQMDLVKLYFIDVKKQINKPITTFTDCYLAVFFPLAIGKPDNFVLATEGLSASLIAGQNKIFDTDHNTQIEKREVTEYFRQSYKKIFDSEINILGTIKNGLETVATFLILPVAVFFYTAFTVNIL